MQKWNGRSFIFMTFVLYRPMGEKECNSYRQVHLLKILGIISLLRSIRILIWYSDQLLASSVRTWPCPSFSPNPSYNVTVHLWAHIKPIIRQYHADCVHVQAVEWGRASYLHEMFWLWHPLVCRKIALLIFCKSKIVSWWLGEIFRKCMRVICCTSNMQDH